METKSNFAEKFGRWIEDNEIIIESDNSPDAWEFTNDIWNALNDKGFSGEVYYVEGGRCPHIHLKFDRALTSEEKELFIKTFVPSQHLAYADMALCHRHRIARENCRHYKYGEIKQLWGRWGDKQNIFPNLQKPEKVEIAESSRPMHIFQYNRSVSKIIAQKLRITELARSHGVRFRGSMAFCPFHPDGKNPNLSFDDSKGLFHCFSSQCNASGNIIKFNAMIKKVKNGSQ